MEEQPLKEQILQSATALIQESGGDLKQITARAIAQRANVGLGLINYHFGSKDALVTECVQRIITKVIHRFRPAQSYETDKGRLTGWATEVFEFLYENKAISRVSILGDLSHYTKDCNSVKTQQGFLRALTDALPESQRPLAVFALTAAMQIAFLGGDTAGELLGIDLNQPEGRRSYIHRLVSLLLEGGGSQ